MKTAGKRQVPNRSDDETGQSGNSPTRPFGMEHAKKQTSGNDMPHHRPASTRKWIIGVTRRFDPPGMEKEQRVSTCTRANSNEKPPLLHPPPTCAASLLGSLLFELAVSCRGRFAHTRAVPVNGTGKGGPKGTYKQKLYPTSTPPAPIKGEGGTNI